MNPVAKISNLLDRRFLIGKTVVSQSNKQCTGGSRRSPSPLNGERAGVRGGNVETPAHCKVSRRAHPSPSIPLPVEGRGKSCGSRPSAVILSLILSLASLSDAATADLVFKNGNV